MINENNKHSWCVNAFHAMSANNNGTTKICCMIRNDEIRNQNLNTYTIEENFNKADFIKIRNDLENGVRHSDCRWCWQEEDSGRKSKRMRDNEKYLGHLERGGDPFEGLAKFELNLGNICNLKCRTCAPYSSSQWMKENFDLYEHKNYKNDYKAYANNMKKYHLTYDDDSQFWPDLEKNLHTIRQFDFYGGEPFMSNKMWRILEVCVEKDYAKNIELHYATNATLWPEEKIKLFTHFKHVNLNFSIDGVGKKFEYMRFPADWNEAKENMNKAVALQKNHHDIHISWCITISLLNIYDIEEVLKEHRENFGHFGSYLNLVHWPTHFNLGIVPEPYKTKIINKLESIPKIYFEMWQQHLPGVINFIKNGKPDSEQWRIFKEKVLIHDNYRKQNFAETFPEYAKVLGLKNE
jgi:MoaA/NifB/PqqE/SkfB family radical SAM enzyme